MRYLALILLISLSLIAVQIFSQNAGFSGSPSNANIIITNFSIPSNISVGSPLIFIVNLENNGEFASANMILNVRISGASSFNDNYTIDALSAFQNESISISKYDRTSNSGAYKIAVNVSYMSNGTLHYSNSMNSSYNITGNAQQEQNITPIFLIPGLSLTYLPVYTSLYSGTEAISQIGIQNTGNSTEYVNLSAMGNYSTYISLSTSSPSLLPNQILEVQLLFKPKSTKGGIATYKIPVNFNVTTASGKNSSVSEYLTLTVLNGTKEKPMILDQIILLNYTSQVKGIIELQSGSSQNITNATLSTFLPINITDNISNIQTFGLAANVFENTGRYEIDWYAPYLSRGQVLYAYYTINNLAKQVPLDFQNILSSPSAVKPINLLRIVNFSLPTIYTNSTNKISVNAFYTGEDPQTVYFYLAAPSGVTIRNSSQVENATPNQLISKSFEISTNSNPGTILLTLYINTKYANLTYSLPILVLENPNRTTGINLGLPSLFGMEKTLIDYGAIALAILLILLLIYGAIILSNRPRYNSKRAKKLMDVKEQIKRKDDGFG